MDNQIADLLDDALCTVAEQDFDAARKFVASNVTRIPDAEKLRLYGLYKQATEGPCTTGQPGMFDFKGKAKWDAWKALGDMEPEEAMATYADVLADAIPTWQEEAGESGKGGAAGAVMSSLAGGQQEEDQGPETLHQWVLKGDVAVVAEMLERAADVDERDSEGCTALHFAADRGLPEMIALLVANGADINARDTDSATPLHYAALCGNVEAYKQLLDLGADPSARDDSGETPEQQAPPGWDRLP